MPIQFSYCAFESCFKSLEKSTTWKYNGGTDIIAVVAHKPKAILGFDWGRAIAVSVEALDRDRKFDMSQYVVDLINSAKEEPTAPLRAFEEAKTISTILKIFKSVVPKELTKAFDAAATHSLSLPRPIKKGSSLD